MLHPADELAALRAEIKKLRAREAVLRTGFLNGSIERHGVSYCVEVKKVVSPVFVKERLPDYILNAPNLWDRRCLQQVQTMPRILGGRRPGAIPGGASASPNLVK